MVTKTELYIPEHYRAGQTCQEHKKKGMCIEIYLCVEDNLKDSQR